MDLANRVANYLVGLHGITSAIPVKVTIGKETFAGARYSQTTNGVTKDAIYCVGSLPKSKRKGKVCYPFESVDWYIACYYEGSDDMDEERERKYHPFGYTFILMPWNVDESIDYYGNKPYKRIPLTVENLA